MGLVTLKVETVGNRTSALFVRNVGAMAEYIVASGINEHGMWDSGRYYRDYEMAATIFEIVNID